MAWPTYFVQACPTCGRNLHVRVEYLGRTVVCQHCHARFEACDPANSEQDYPQPTTALMRRVEELLDSPDTLRVRPR